MRSKLTLEINPTADCSKLRVEDTSIYNEDIVVECPQLLITIPGFVDPIHITSVIAPNFNIALTAYELKLQASQDIVSILPDGVYNIHYSIDPNEQLFVEYNHLRDCQIKAAYFEKVCALELLGCENELQEKEIKQNYEKLQEVDFYIKAAKAYVEQCDAPNKGMDLFRYASTLLSRINLKCNHC